MRAVGFLLGIKNTELRTLHTRRFEEALAHLLLFQGDALGNSGEALKALAAFVKCAALSLTYRDQIVIRLGNHGNNLYRQGRISEAISFYAEALKLAPERIDLRFMRAEALASAGRTADARKEYLKIFERESLGDPVWERIQSVNPLSLVWRTGDRCFFLFRTQQGSFQGSIRAGRKIRDVRRHILVRRDRLSYEGGLLRFDFSGGRGVVKIFSFKLPPESGLNIDIRTDGQRRTTHVVDLELGTHPQRLPYDK